MWLQSVLQANCCWEASLLLWIKHYCQCIKKPCCILPSPPSLFLIITKELLLVQSFAKKAFSTHEGDSSCALWWDQGGVADSNESLQKNKVLTKPQGRMTRLKSASKTWLSSWRRIIDLNLQLNGTHTHTHTNQHTAFQSSWIWICRAKNATHLVSGSLGSGLRRGGNFPDPNQMPCALWGEKKALLQTLICLHHSRAKKRNWKYVQPQIFCMCHHCYHGNRCL